MKQTHRSSSFAVGCSVLRDRPLRYAHSVEALPWYNRDVGSALFFPGNTSNPCYSDGICQRQVKGAVDCSGRTLNSCVLLVSLISWIIRGAFLDVMEQANT